MASSLQERVYRKELTFEGRSSHIFYADNACALVAIANVLSLKGKLVHLSEPRVMNDLLSLVAAQLRMNSAEPHQGQRIDDAIKILPQLAAQIDAKPNYRRIQDLGDFKGQDVFKLLGVPIYHTDGSNSSFSETGKEKKGDLEELSELEKAIQLSLAEVTSVSAEKGKEKKGDLEELSELEKAIQLSLAEVTSVSAEKALSKEENGLCVFYWNGSFDTICKINNELFFLAASEDVVEWRHLDQRRESKFNPIIGEFTVRIPEVSVKIAVVAMEAESEVCFCEAMNCYKGIWEKVVEANLSNVIDSLRKGLRYDLLVMNYSFIKDEMARDKACIEKLRKEGFAGEIAALGYGHDLPEDDLQFLIDTEIYVAVDEDLEGVTLIRECLDGLHMFRVVLDDLIEKAKQNREFM